MLLRAVAREDRSRPERLRREEGAVEHLACAATPPDKVPASRRPREQSHLRSGGDRRGAARVTLDTDARYCAPASDPDGDAGAWAREFRHDSARRDLADRGVVRLGEPDVAVGPCNEARELASGDAGAIAGDRSLGSDLRDRRGIVVPI